ncbi:RhoGEF domain [Teratosphaeria destructans]|uniref:RhoGEF domain n=1 Tax=Teratosphaeria destructans TaxID=418781 RepID=A0A9W7VZV6_9PEZI|nr:RhoGEF domain [Teratosphaeria destructans]
MYANGSFCASRSSVSSTATVQHHKIRSISTSSLSSVGSLLSRKHVTDSTTRSVSTFNLTGFASRRGSWTSAFQSAQSSEASECQVSDTVKLGGVAEDANEEEESPARVRLPSTPSDSDETIGNQGGTVPAEKAELGDLSSSPEPQAFQRWVSRLKRRKMEQPSTVTPRTQRWALDDFDVKAQSSPPKFVRSHHQKAESHASSIAFVTAVKSATATIASASIATISRRNSKWRREQRSSILSDPRPSVDTQRSIVDAAARQRSRRRRDKVQELILTEEGYVADLKALFNALSTLLGYQTDCQSSVRNCASTTLARLICLHQEMVAELQHCVPFLDREPPVRPAGVHRHHRWHSVDGTTPRRKPFSSLRHPRRSLNISRSSEDDAGGGLTCEPAVVAAVAAVFNERLAQFQEYENFGGYYELVRMDIQQLQESITAWLVPKQDPSEYDSAIEALAGAIHPTKSREIDRRKALTLKDLLIKPIQRLPRYELLFDDLRKFTPVCDDPVSHGIVERLLKDLNRLCHRMNEAKEDHTNVRTLGATWLIGERLTFSSQVPRSVYLQLLGQVVLCGCLHIAYRNRERVKGCYVICILFESTLLLATAADDQQRYSTLAGIALANATIAECENLKGLQSCTTPHSWKLVFEHTARMYEVIFTACSAQEHDMWRQQLVGRIGAQTQAVASGATNIFELHSPIIAEMRSIGKAFGKPSTFVEQMSVHRTATVGPTTDLNQVVIKNTQAVKEALETTSTVSLPIGRSQTVVTPSHVQTLAPRRADRVRLEALLSDVWTKEVLPYPGMAPRRTDPLRASANHVMRKFSMASIASNFSSSKRNASYTSVSSSVKDSVLKEDVPPQSKGRCSENKRQRPARQPLVDFHNAPEAFLPEDFDLQDSMKHKKSALRTLTMTMERPFTPLLAENKPSGLRRTQSVRESAAETAEPVVLKQESKPVYSVVQQSALEVPTKTPRKMKSKNKLLRMFL